MFAFARLHRQGKQSFPVQAIHLFYSFLVLPKIFLPVVFISCIQKMDSMYHVRFSSCHPRQNSAMNTFHHLTEVCAQFDVTFDSSHLHLLITILALKASKNML